MNILTLISRLEELEKSPEAVFQVLTHERVTVIQYLPDLLACLREAVDLIDNHLNYCPNDFISTCNCGACKVYNFKEKWCAGEDKENQ